MKLLRNPLIVGILLVLAGFLVLRSFRGTLWHRWFPPKRPAPTAGAALPAPPTPPVTPPSPPPRTVPDQGIDFSQVGWIKSLRRDPFRATGRILLVETPTGPSGKAQELLNLQAIWRQTASRMAVINGRIITEGEAKIYEVDLNEQFHLGVDWQRVIKQADLTVEAKNIVSSPQGGVTRSASSVFATFASGPGKYGQIAATLEALKEQGEVKVVSQPRLRSMNNQTAIIKIGTDTPFFSSSSGFVAGQLGGAGGTFQNQSFQMITVGTILAITPQISSNGWITLDVSPVITSLAGTESTGASSNRITAPILDIKQSSSLIRVNNGETIIIGGLIKDKQTKTVRSIPFLGDIPLLGRLFRGTFQSKEKNELVIFLTPHVVEDQ